MPMMTTKNIHSALRSAKALGPKGQEADKLKAALASEGMRLGQLHNIFVSKKGSKQRPFPHMILLLEEVTREVREYFHIVLSFSCEVLEGKHPHKERKSESDTTRFFGGSRANLLGMNSAD